jgi:hypothetical protein
LETQKARRPVGFLRSATGARVRPPGQADPAKYWAVTVQSPAPPTAQNRTCFRKTIRIFLILINGNI